MNQQVSSSKEQVARRNLVDSSSVELKTTSNKQPTTSNQNPATSNQQEDSLAVDLNDGRSISAPLSWYPRLYHGTFEERNRWEIIGNGAGIHWPELDEDLSVESILAGRPSMENATSLKKWLEQRK